MAGPLAGWIPCQAVLLGEVVWVEILLCHLWNPPRNGQWLEEQQQESHSLGVQCLDRVVTPCTLWHPTTSE